MNFDYEQVKSIWLKTIEVLTILVTGMIMYRYSILNKIQENKIIKKQALTDPLTGKGNRHKFLADMDEHIKREKKFAICFMDLDGFKHVNDTMGHDAGDLLLVSLSNMLQDNLPSTCVPYRLGGDEFAIIIDKINTIQEITNILDNLKNGLKTPIPIDNTKIVLEYSLGVAIYPTDGDTRSDLVSYADDAMYYIKENGKNDYYFHNEALKAKLDNKKKMEIDLKDSLEKNDFDIEFQPRVNIKKLDDIFLEVLLYWNHPILGKLNSEYFIKQAEEMGISVYLDEFVLKKTCEKLDQLKLEGKKNVKFAVNLSNVHAKRHDFVDKLCEILDGYKFSRGDIQIEFTDNVNIKYLSSYKYMIDKLKERGVNIAICNLEVKYDVLSLFKELDIDEIKLNAKYVSKTSNFNKNTLKDIVDISKNLDYLVNVIHIEDEEELKYAINSGADKVQGNYLFKRIGNTDLAEFLKNYYNFKNSLEKVIIKLENKG